MGGTIILGGSPDETANQFHRLPFPDGKLLFEDPNFDAGYRGWNEFYNPTNNAPLSLSPFPGIGGLALRLSTSIKRSTVTAGNCYAIKRMMRPAETGVVVYETLWTGGGENGLLNPFDFEWMIDTCNFANTHRSFPRYRYCLTDGTSFERVNELRARKNKVGGGNEYRNSGITLEFPFNENKQNINRTIVKFDLGANGGLGGYVSFQINQTLWTMVGTEAAEAAEEEIQGGGESASFRGGLNFVVGVLGNSHEDVGHAYMNVIAARAYIE